MSCYHRYPHGCGWPVVPPGYIDDLGYAPRYRDRVVVVPDDDDDWGYEPPRRRRYRSERQRPVREERASTTSLRSRAEALRAELDRIEEELSDLAAAPDADATG